MRGTAGMFSAVSSRLDILGLAFGLAVSAVASHAAGPTPFPHAIVQPYIDRGELPGAVAMTVSRDDILSLEAIGYADLAARVPMRKDALFWIASMSKPIAATAMMMLVDEGRVKLDDPVRKYLPGFDPRIMVASKDGRKIRLARPPREMTIRHLLTHSSGLPFGTSLENPQRDWLPLDVAVRSYALQPLVYAPGTDQLYSNAGINVAGRIIEVVTGKPYDLFLQQRLFDPLGMKDTGFRPDAARIARLAKSYYYDAEAKALRETRIMALRSPLSAPGQLMPAGGLFSTAGDLSLFCRMLLNNGTLDGRRYLTPEAMREMTRDQTTEDIRRTWRATRFTKPATLGLGWVVSASGAYQHGGAYNTDMRIDPANGIATVWLVQIADKSGAGAIEAYEKAAVERFGTGGPAK